jgi:hypothetical protein
MPRPEVLPDIPPRKVYSFNDVAGTFSGPMTISQREDAEPISLNFNYFDKDGLGWHVVAEGYRVKDGNMRTEDGHIQRIERGDANANA